MSSVITKVRDGDFLHLSLSCWALGFLTSEMISSISGDCMQFSSIKLPTIPVLPAIIALIVGGLWDAASLGNALHPLYSYRRTAIYENCPPYS